MSCKARMGFDGGPPCIFSLKRQRKVKIQQFVGHIKSQSIDEFWSQPGELGAPIGCVVGPQELEWYNKKLLAATLMQRNIQAKMSGLFFVLCVGFSKDHC